MGEASAASVGACAIVSANGRACSEPVDSDAPLNLCARHLLAAHDWVARDVGTTDTLPSPCLACGSRLGVRYPSGWLCAICDWRVGDLPHHNVAGLRVDVVYYLRRGDQIKIGTSGNVRNRLAALHFDEVLAFERGNRQREHRRHLQFGSYRILRTEWFDVHDALSDHIRTLREGIDDPWSQYALWRSQQIALHG